MKRLLMACAAGLVVSAAAAPVAASDAGSLIVLPARGTIDQPIDVVTSGVCTRGVTFVVAVRGEGIDPITSGNAVGNTALGTLEPAVYPGHHAVPLSRTLREYFLGNGLGAPGGEYDLIFACRNRLDLEDLQTFTGSIRIKGDTYTALGDAGRSVEALLADQAEAPNQESSTPAAAGTSPSASGSGSAGGGGQVDAATAVGASDPVTTDSAPAPPGGGAEPTAPPDPAAATVHPSSALSPHPNAGASTASSSSSASQDSAWRTLLGVVGILLLLGAGYAWWKSRRMAQ